MRRAVLPLVLLATLSAPALAGPPWISIEYPSNPHDPSTRGAFLLVHSFHHGTPIQSPVSGRAIGLVGGERRTVELAFERTSRSGVYALRGGVNPQGRWVLVISVTQDAEREDVAQALVEVQDGVVTRISVPTRQQDRWTIPRKVTEGEIAAALGRAGR